MMNAKDFLKTLREDVEKHSAVTHPLLAELGEGTSTRDDFKIMGLQHYPLVANFTTYMEILLVRAPNSDAKQWLAKVLVDEYGEGSDNKDHATVYLEFLAACGAKQGEEYTAALHPAVTDFIDEHRRICNEEPYLVGLGALGPGHEWSIPKMFPPLCEGLRRAGLKPEEMLYFDLHMEQDIDHGLWLEEALLMFAETPEEQELIRRGAMLSLAARERFWAGVQQKVAQGREPNQGPLQKQSGWARFFGPREYTLEQFRRKFVSIQLAC